MGVLIALAVASAAWVPLRPYVLALDVALVLAVIVDFARTPSPRELDVRRSLPERAGLSQEFKRVVRIRLPEEAGRAALAVELHEEFAPPLEVCARTLDEDGAREPVAPAPGDPTGGPDRGFLVPGGSLELARTYRSHLRGLHGVGDMRLRLRGAMGLVQRQSRLFGDQGIAIEPPLLGLKNTLRLAASERWRDLGVRKLRRLGGKTEFESLRDYVIGDDVRVVDWKAFAKRGRPIVRQYQQEQGQELILMVDCGRRMGATTAEGQERGWSKLDFALDAALQVAAVALQQRDRVGILAFDSAVRVFEPPARGGRQLARLREAVFDLLPSELESDISRALRELEIRNARRAMLLVLSDVADPLSVDLQSRALATGSRRYRIVFAGMDDPSLRAAADGRSTVSPSVRGAACAVLEERRIGLHQLARAGVRVVDTLPAEAAGPMLAAWLDERRTG